MVFRYLYQIICHANKSSIVRQTTRPYSRRRQRPGQVLCKRYVRRRFGAQRNKTLTNSKLASKLLLCKDNPMERSWLGLGNKNDGTRRYESIISRLQQLLHTREIVLSSVRDYSSSCEDYKCPVIVKTVPEEIPLKPLKQKYAPIDPPKFCPKEEERTIRSDDSYIAPTKPLKILRAQSHPAKYGQPPESAPLQRLKSRYIEEAPRVCKTSGPEERILRADDNLKFHKRKLPKLESAKVPELYERKSDLKRLKRLPKVDVLEPPKLRTESVLSLHCKRADYNIRVGKKRLPQIKFDFIPEEKKDPLPEMKLNPLKNIECTGPPKKSCVKPEPFPPRCDDFAKPVPPKPLETLILTEKNNCVSTHEYNKRKETSTANVTIKRKFSLMALVTNPWTISFLAVNALALNYYTSKMTIVEDRTLYPANEPVVNLVQKSATKGDENGELAILKQEKAFKILKPLSKSSSLPNNKVVIIPLVKDEPVDLKWRAINPLNWFPQHVQSRNLPYSVPNKQLHTLSQNKEHPKFASTSSKKSEKKCNKRCVKIKWPGIPGRQRESCQKIYPEKSCTKVKCPYPSFSESTKEVKFPVCECTELPKLLQPKHKIISGGNPVDPVVPEWSPIDVEVEQKCVKEKLAIAPGNTKTCQDFHCPSPYIGVECLKENDKESPKTKSKPKEQSKVAAAPSAVSTKPSNPWKKCYASWAAVRDARFMSTKTEISSKDSFWQSMCSLFKSGDQQSADALIRNKAKPPPSFKCRKYNKYEDKRKLRKTIRKPHKANIVQPTTSPLIENGKSNVIDGPLGTGIENPFTQLQEPIPIMINVKEGGTPPPQLLKEPLPRFSEANPTVFNEHEVAKRQTKTPKQHVLSNFIFSNWTKHERSFSTMSREQHCSTLKSHEELKESTYQIFDEPPSLDLFLSVDDTTSTPDEEEQIGITEVLRRLYKKAYAKNNDDRFDDFNELERVFNAIEEDE